MTGNDIFKESKKLDALALKQSLKKGICRDLDFYSISLQKRRVEVQLRPWLQPAYIFP